MTRQRKSLTSRQTLSILAFMLASNLVVAVRAGNPISPFTEEAAARGISYLSGSTGAQFGAGVCIADLDNDGDPDVVVGGAANGIIGVYENDGTGNFTDRSAGSGIPSIVMPSSITAADFDSDGDLDLHIGNFLSADLLLRNDGNFVFVDIAVSAGVASLGAAQGVTWGDYNADGWLDFYVCNRTGTFGSSIENHFFVNNGDSTFTDLAATLGIQAPGEPTLVAAFLDYDLDGDADLYLGTDKGTGPALTNHLFQNSNGTFVDVTAQTNTEANVDCMGIAIGDWTRNGFSDIYVTNVPPGNVLLLQQPDNTFIDYTVQAEVESFGTSWATFFFDYDNDQWLELYSCNAAFVSTLGFGNRLYEHDGVWPAVDLGPSLNVDTLTNNYTAAFGDLDLDGDLDMVVPASGKAFPSTEEAILVLINNEGQKRNWAKFDIVGSDSNGFAVGARIDLRLGSDWFSREVFAGSNYKSQNEMPLHFGLGSASIIDELQVLWPDGSTRTLTNYPANRNIRIFPSSRLGDMNEDGNFDLSDLPAFAACVDGPTTASILPGCELADINSDGAIDLNDYAGMAIQQGN